MSTVLIYFRKASPMIFLIPTAVFRFLSSLETFLTMNSMNVSDRKRHVRIIVAE
jgi:hypothetical protein